MGELHVHSVNVAFAKKNHTSINKSQNNFRVLG